nr:hypothetical transcript [Hymenolepis microstoma]
MKLLKVVRLACKMACLRTADCRLQACLPFSQSVQQCCEGPPVFFSASSGGMDAEVSKYPEFSGFESPCLVTSLQLSTEGSAEVVVRPNKDDFSYWSFISGWS